MREQIIIKKVRSNIEKGDKIKINAA